MERQNLHKCNHLSQARTTKPCVTQVVVLIICHVLVMSVNRARMFALHSHMALLITGSKRGCYSGEWLICEVPIQPWYRTYWNHQLGSQSATWVLVYSICDTVSGMLLAVRVLRDINSHTWCFQTMRFLSCQCGKWVLWIHKNPQNTSICWKTCYSLK